MRKNCNENCHEYCRDDIKDSCENKILEKKTVPSINNRIPVYVNTNFTIYSLFQHLIDTNDDIKKYFELNNIVLLPPSHYNITTNLQNGGINISSNFERHGQVTLKINVCLPIGIYYNKCISGLKTQLNKLDIKNLVLNNKSNFHVCTGAYKGFTKEALACFLNVDYSSVIFNSLESLTMFNYPVKLHLINTFRTDKNKWYVFLPKLLVDLGIILVDDCVGEATLNCPEQTCDSSLLSITALHIEYNKNIPERNKQIALSLADILRKYFNCSNCS